MLESRASSYSLKLSSTEYLPHIPAVRNPIGVATLEHWEGYISLSVGNHSLNNFQAADVLSAQPL